MVSFVLNFLVGSSAESNRHLCRPVDKPFCRWYTIYIIKQEKEKKKMKEKSAFGGWFLMWVLSTFAAIYARAGRLSDSDYALELATFQRNGEFIVKVCEETERKLYYHPTGTPCYPEPVYSEVEYFIKIIEMLDEIYDMPGVDINFKNTLLAVRKQWVTKTE